MRDASTVTFTLTLTVAIGGWMSEARRRRQLQRQLMTAEYAAMHDLLTGLLNRAGWARSAPRALAAARASGRPAAVVLVDLDGFKAINDTLGHVVGDDVLRVAACRLQQMAGLSGVAARLGGDEFALILVGPLAAAADWAAAAAKSMHRQLAAPTFLAGHLIRIRASIGVTPATADSPSLLLGRADVVMYHCKRTRSGVAVDDP